MGNVMADMKRYGEAAEHFKEAVDAGSPYTYPNARASEMLAMLDRNAEALEYMLAVEAAEPGDADVHLKLGILYSRLDREEKAADEYAACISIDPSMRAAHANRSIALSKLGRDTEALECAREAVKVDPGYAHGHIALATLLAQTGQEKEAREHIGIAVKIDPRYINDPLGTHMGMGYAAGPAAQSGYRKAGKPRRPVRRMSRKP